MFDYGLTQQQLAVISALSNGATMAAAAEQAGVHRNTINNWRRNSLPFQQALADAQYDRALYFREKMEDLVDLATEALHAILTDPKTSPSVRLRAALAVLNQAAIPPAPKKQVELDIERIVIHKNLNNSAQTNPEFCVHPGSSAANSNNPKNLHNTAQTI